MGVGTDMANWRLCHCLWHAGAFLCFPMEKAGDDLMRATQNEQEVTAVMVARKVSPGFEGDDARLVFANHAAVRVWAAVSWATH